MIGLIFGRWEVLAEREKDKNQNRQLLCRCACGTEKVVNRDNLVGGKSVSCGCYRRYRASRDNRTHGESKTLLYGVWKAMKSRCHNPNSTSRKNYGDRGITVSSEWRDSFETFCADMGDKPHHNSQIDRIHNDLGYSKDNCRWVTPAVNAVNKRNNARLTYEGKTLCFSEWSVLTGIHQSTLRRRIRVLGWSVGKAVTTPIDKRKSKIYPELYGTEE